MKPIQKDCVTISQYALEIGKSVRTVQRYVAQGLPVIKGCAPLIHLPTANAYWLSRMTGGNGAVSNSGHVAVSSDAQAAAKEVREDV